MKTSKFKSLPAAFLMLNCIVFAQTNATYDLSRNAISGGGGESSSATLKIVGTVGQAVAGTTSTNAVYSLHGGFWFAPPLAPTAARVSVGGRIFDGGGGGVRGARVTLSDMQTGEIRSAQTNSFGFYRFEEVAVGRVYLLAARSKKFRFAPENQVFSLLDARDDLDFTALDPN